MHQSLQGQLLIASPMMDDPNFSRTVLLIVQHDEMGALGIVLNRPLGIPVKEVWEKISDTPCFTPEKLSQGGPCESLLMVLSPVAELGQIQVLPELHYSTDPDHLNTLIQSESQPAKYFIGYSGWGPMQLDTEVNTGSWFSHPAHPNDIFRTESDPYEQLLSLSDPVTKIMKQQYHREMPNRPDLN